MYLYDFWLQCDTINYTVTVRSIGVNKMLNQSEKLFTAGQFAKMHGINKRTLMYYDDIGLLSPVKRGNNSYRYYSYMQSQTLEILLSLREIDVSIEEIKQYMNNRSPEALVNLLTEKTNQIDEKIKKLADLQTMLLNKKETVQRYSQIVYDTIEIIECPEAYFYLSRFIRDVSANEELEIIMEHSAECHTHRFYNHTFGTMLPSSAILNKDFSGYEYYFTKVNAINRDLKNIHIRPAGSYIRMFHKGNWDTYHHAYKNIITFLEENQLSITGYAYEEGVIDEMSISSMDDFVAEILIQVK